MTEPDSHTAEATDTSRADFSLAAVMEVQDQLLTAATDLERLKGLIDEAGRDLMSQFYQMVAACEQGDVDTLRKEVGGAMTALQFQDMAGQLVAHTIGSLRSVSDLIGNAADAEDAVEVNLPTRASPVAQRGMDAGSAELF